MLIKKILYISHKGSKLELLKRINPKQAFSKFKEQKTRTVMNVSLQEFFLLFSTKCRRGAQV